MDHPQSFARSEMLSSSLPASAPVERAHEAGDADRPLTSEGRPEQHQNTGPISSENVDGHPSTPHRTIRLPHYRTLTGHVASPSRTPLFTAGSDPLSTPPSAFRQPLPAPAPRDGPLPSVPSSTFPYTASAMGATRRDSRDDGTLPAFPSRHHHHHDQHSPHGHGEFPPPPFSTSVLITPSKTAPAPPLAVQTGAVGRTVYSSGVRRLPGPDGSQMIPCEFAAEEPSRITLTWIASVSHALERLGSGICHWQWIATAVPVDRWRRDFSAFRVPIPSSLPFLAWLPARHVAAGQTRSLQRVTAAVQFRTGAFATARLWRRIRTFGAQLVDEPIRSRSGRESVAHQVIAACKLCHTRSARSPRPKLRGRQPRRS